MAETSETPTIVAFLLDKSGSMNIIKEATLEGFNGYLTGLQSDTTTTMFFTLFTFDDISIDKIHVCVPIQDVPFLTQRTYVPRGGTPLIEAAVKIIRSVEEALLTRSDNPKVTICFQTDGRENASGREYTNDVLKNLIEDKRKLGWQFNFLGADIDVYSVADRYGISASGTMSYNAQDLATTRSAFASSAVNVVDYAIGNSVSTDYLETQRYSAGDKFYQQRQKSGKAATE